MEGFSQAQGKPNAGAAVGAALKLAQVGAVEGGLGELGQGEAAEGSAEGDHFDGCSVWSDSAGGEEDGVLLGRPGAFLVLWEFCSRRVLSSATWRNSIFVL